MNSRPSIAEISPAAFKPAVLDAALPVLVAVCAAGCPTSQRLLALLAAWAPQVADRLSVVQIRAEKLAELERHGGFAAAPGLLLFYRGAVSYQFLGELSRNELDDLLIYTDGLASTATPSQGKGDEL
jgi:thioredoxin-like negative regulator of GroEL